MKKLKYLAVAGIATAALFSGQNASAEAVTATKTEGAVAQIKVTGVDSSDTFRACKVVDIVATQNELYDFTASFEAYNGTGESAKVKLEDYQDMIGTTKGGFTSGDAATIDQLAADYAKYVDANGVSCEAMTVSGTTATLATPEGGSYLIIPTSTKNVYSAMIASVPVDLNDDGEYVLDDTAKVATVAAKKGDSFAVIETVTGEGVYAVNQPIDFRIDATIPNYPIDIQNKELTITDEVDSRLTIDESTISVVDKNGTAINPDLYTVSVEGNTITVNVNDATQIDSSMSIKYKASIKQTAPAGTEFLSTAKMEYPTDLYGATVATSEESSVAVETYGIKIFKLNEESKNIAGAKFSITDKGGNDVTCYDEAGILVTTFVSSLDKAIVCKGIAPGEYTLTETEAPDGYTVAEPVKVTLTSEGKYSYTNDGTLLAKSLVSGYAEVNVKDKKFNFALPFTGGKGVIIYAIAGVTIVVAASNRFIIKKARA